MTTIAADANTATTTPTTTSATSATVATPETTTPTTLTARPSGFADGVYLGTAEYTEWGDVQVQVTISDGGIVNVAAVEYPSSSKSSASAMSATSVAGVRRVEHHMGTTVSLQAHDAPADAADRFFDEIRTLEARLSRFRHDSEVMRIERGELSLDDASPQVREVVVRCEVLRAATGGAFDHRPVVDGRQLLDPNAFVKGWIIEQAVLHLQLAGVGSYFVNAGGDVVVGAPPPGQASWGVGITHPDDPTAVFATVDLEHGAIATSGSYERGNHLRSATTPSLAPSKEQLDELTSVSVVGPELATADALATAVFAGGESRPSWWHNDSPYGIIALAASGSVRYTANLAGNIHVGRP